MKKPESTCSRGYRIKNIVKTCHGIKNRILYAKPLSEIILTKSKNPFSPRKSVISILIKMSNNTEKIDIQEIVWALIPTLSKILLRGIAWSA